MTTIYWSKYQHYLYIFYNTWKSFSKQIKGNNYKKHFIRISIFNFGHGNITCAQNIVLTMSLRGSKTLKYITYGWLAQNIMQRQCIVLFPYNSDRSFPSNSIAFKLIKWEPWTWKYRCDRFSDIEFVTILAN